MELAEEKLAVMPNQNADVVIQDGSLNILTLPNWVEISRMEHSDFIRVLRLHPGSRFFGYTETELSETTLSFDVAKTEVVELLRKEYQGDSYLNSIKEIEEEYGSNSDRCARKQVRFNDAY